MLYRFPVRNRIPAWLAWVGFLWLAAPMLLAATLTATLEPDSVSVGESTTLTLLFENGRPDGTVTIPEVKNLSIKAAGKSSGMALLNGQMTTSLTLTYVVTPLQPGEYVIPAVVANVDGKRVQSQPVKLTAMKAGASAEGSGSAPKFAFLKLLVPRTEVYVGEILPVEVRLYVVNGRDLQWTPLAADGFVLGKMVNAPQTRVQSGQIVYQVVAFKTTATATKTGVLKLGPAECDLNLLIPQSRRQRSNDPFDSFFNDSFFGPRAELKPTHLVSETQEITVKPLPSANAPRGFSPAVGEFSLQVSAGPTNVAVGDPVTLRIQVAGKGALDTISPPSMEGFRQFKVYPPTSKVDVTDDLGMEGVKTFEVSVVPESTEVKEIPPIAFSYFSAAAGAYQTLQQAAIPIVVRPSASQPTLTVSGTNAVAVPNPAAPPQAIVHIKARSGELTAALVPLVARPWFLGLQALPFLIWGVLLGVVKYREHLSRNPRLVRRQRVRKIVREGLEGLRQSASARDTDAFFASLFKLLQEQLGERLDLPAASITEAVVDQNLRQRGLPQDVEAELRELFQFCNQARYAPSQMAGDLQAIQSRANNVFHRLQEWNPTA